MNTDEYQKIVKKYSPKEHKMQNMLVAFFVGGLVGLLGQLIVSILESLNINHSDSTSIMIVILIFISSFLTSLGIFDNMVCKAQAGLIVPITGFANSIVAPAMEYKSEGYVMGVGSKMFTVAGPVLVYGISTSIVVGLAYLIFNAQSVL